MTIEATPLLAGLYAQAHGLFVAKRFAMAEAVCTRLLALAPDSGETVVLLVRILWGQDRFEEAAELLRRTAHIVGDGDLAVIRTESARQFGQIGLAIKHCKEALIFRPDSFDLWLYFAQFSLYLRNLEIAFQSFRRAAMIDPGAPTIHVEIGNALKTVGRLPLALDAFSQAIRIADNAQARVGLGTVLDTMGRLAEAEPHFARAVALSPDTLEAWQAWMRSLRLLDRDAEARQALGQAAVIFADDPLAMFHLATEALEQGDGEAALAFFKDRRIPDISDPPDEHSVPAVHHRIHPGKLCRARGWPYHRMSAEREQILPDSMGEQHRLQLQETYLAYVENARIVTGNWVVTVDEHLLAGGLNHYAPTSLHSMSEFAACAANGRVLTDLRPPEHHVEEEAILIGGINNWSHWVHDYLSRFVVLERFPQLDHLPLLVSSRMFGSIRDLIGMLGIDTGRLRPLPDVKIVSAARLWLPSLTHTHLHVAPTHVDFLRRRLAPWIGAGMRRPRRRLFLRRQGAAHRSLVNEAEILEALAPLGVEPVLPEDYPVAEQIAMFASADLVIGPLGGGTAVLLFAPPGAAYLELTHSRMTIPQYRVLTAILGQRFGQVIGECLENHGATAYDFDFRVDPQQVVKAVRSLLEG